MAKILLLDKPNSLHSGSVAVPTSQIAVILDTVIQIRRLHIVEEIALRSATADSRYGPMRVDTPIFHRNRYHADAVCAHCSGIVRHQAWCITTNKAVLYAYEVAIHPEKLDDSDRRILHTLGVNWVADEAVAFFLSRGLPKNLAPCACKSLVS